MESEDGVAIDKNVVVLIGGVGGAKLARGLVEVVDPEQLTFIVNTGDDFCHLGLKICPDLDTLMYTLSGLVDPTAGWGLADDSFTTLESLEARYGIEPWFRLGDKDLATHLFRTQLLRQGLSLTAATACLAEKLGIRARLLPMCDEPVPTIVDTVEHGEIGFQEYFVKHGWQPVVKSIHHQGCEQAQLSAAARDALSSANMVLIAPSNPWLSIAPILSVAGLRESLIDHSAPVVAVTPIIAGAAVKGPTAKIMDELSIDVSARSVMYYYGAMINGFVDDIRNVPLGSNGLRHVQFDTLMTDLSAKINLARAILYWVAGWTS